MTGCVVELGGAGGGLGDDARLTRMLFPRPAFLVECEAFGSVEEGVVVCLVDLVARCFCTRAWAAALNSDAVET